MNSTRQLLGVGAISLLLQSEGSEVDVDKAVGRPVVAAAGDLAPFADDPLHDVDVFESGLDLERAPALGMRRAARRQPAQAVQAALLTTDFAGAGRAGFSQVDCFLDLSISRRRQQAVPVEAQGPVLLLDLRCVKRPAGSARRRAPAGRANRRRPMASLGTRADRRPGGRYPGRTRPIRSANLSRSRPITRTPNTNATNENKEGTSGNVNS